MNTDKKNLAPISYPQHDDEIDLVELVRALWRGKWVILTCSVLAGVLAVAGSLLLPNMYRSEALLAPASGEADMISSLATKYGGLASLAGIDLGRAGIDKTTLTLKVLTSRAFIVDFVRKHDLVVPLMAAKRWDRERNAWEIDSELYDVSNKRWVREVDFPYKPEPSDLEIYEKFREEALAVSQDAKSGVITLSVTLQSPPEAEQWAEWLIEDINNYMRERDISQANRSIDYLQRQLEQTVVAEMRQIFYQLIEEQTKSMMLAQVQEEYALRVIDPPVTPEIKASPRRMLIVLSVTLVTAFLSASFVVVLSSFRKATISDASLRSK